MKSSPPVSGLTASSNGKVVENIGGPPVGYEPFIGALRYVLTPRLPRWKGVKVFICTSLQAVDCHLAFRICLENGLVIREGAASFAPKPEANWIRLEFPELSNAEGQSFILELRLQEPAWTTKVGLFETQHARSRVRRGARVLGVSPVNRNLFAQLVYTR